MVCRSPSTKEPVLCGITTSSVNCETADFPGKNADISYFSQWIRKTITLAWNETTSANAKQRYELIAS